MDDGCALWGGAAARNVHCRLVDASFAVPPGGVGHGRPVGKHKGGAGHGKSSIILEWPPGPGWASGG